MLRMTTRFVAFFLLALCLTAPLSASPVSTEISIADSFLKGSQNVYLTFTMTNTSPRPIRMLRWNTPFEGIEGNLFEVARNGELVPYLGRVYKRGAPQAEDFLFFAAGESRSTTVELSAVYAMHYTGEYQVRFRGEELHHTPLKGHGAELLDLASNAVVFWVDGEEPPAPGLVPERPWTKKKPGGNNGSNCSNQQLNKLGNALSAARAIAAEAYSYLSGPQNANSARYTEWFGVFSSNRWNSVESNFRAISDALDNEPIDFDCSCNQNYFAYVYPSQPYTIYLCRAFWRASLNGTDSKAGTLVHEVSHFNAVAGTDDVTYGQNSCRALADSSPNSAIRNADSHEYFAENSPSLP